jgi:hypothetical protein
MLGGQAFKETMWLLGREALLQLAALCNSLELSNAVVPAWKLLTRP